VADALTIAERTVLGGLITHPATSSEVFSRIRVTDFTGTHTAVAEAVYGMRLEKKHIDQVTVIDEMQRRGTLGRAGGPAFLAYLAQHATFVIESSIGYHVDIIVRAVRLRRLAVAGHRLVQATDIPDADPSVIAAAAVAETQAVADGIESDGDVLTPTLGEFLAGEDEPYEWVVPGLLERGDRLVLTGSEGLGKSVMMRQIAVCAAAGIHPFTGQRIPAQRVLYVDCENGVRKMRRAYRELRDAAVSQGRDPSDRMWVEVIPEGVDLTKPEDEAWMVRLVAGLQPTLFLTGSLYRLHAENPNDEKPARQVAKVLDRCRVAADCAVIVEGHAGHGPSDGRTRPVRVTGSSLWLRWPEFGYGLRATDDYDLQTREGAVDFVPWRGDRDERHWPRQLSKGRLWPWQAVDNPMRSVA